MWQGKLTLNTITCVVFDGYSTNISELYATQQDAIHKGDEYFNSRIVNCFDRLVAHVPRPQARLFTIFFWHDYVYFLIVTSSMS
jgi:hypothetical protein